MSKTKKQLPKITFRKANDDTFFVHADGRMIDADLVQYGDGTFKFLGIGYNYYPTKIKAARAYLAEREVK